jgi:large subunit ribosomal protein L7/L12
MDEIIAIIRSMTVLELAELVKALEEEFGVSAAAQVVAAVPGTTEEAPKPAEEEKTEFDVTLREIGPNKISVIKTLRELRNLGLKEAKELAETAPNAVLGHGISQEEATVLKLKLEQLGAKVEVK